MKINKAKTSKISNVDFDNLTFGKHFTDHMFICDYKNNSWINARIVPYQNIEISPSARVFHYGQAIFEGMKAYKNNSRTNKIFSNYLIHSIILSTIIICI